MVPPPARSRARGEVWFAALYEKISAQPHAHTDIHKHTTTKRSIRKVSDIDFLAVFRERAQHTGRPFCKTAPLRPTRAMRSVRTPSLEPPSYNPSRATSALSPPLPASPLGHRPSSPAHSTRRGVRTTGPNDPRLCALSVCASAPHASYECAYTSQSRGDRTDHAPASHEIHAHHAVTTFAHQTLPVQSQCVYV